MNKFIQKLTIQNFKSIKELKDFELHNINILIGANGAGKSNFLSFFNLLRNLIDENLPQYIAKTGKADGILTFGRKQSDYLNFEIRFDNNSYGCKLSSTNENSLYFDDEYTVYNGNNGYSNKWHFNGGSENTYLNKSGNNGGSYHSQYFVPQLKKILQYHFHDVGDSSPIKSDEPIINKDKLLYNGKNIAPFLLRLKQDYLDSYSMIVKTIQAVVPDFHDFYFQDNLRSDELITMAWINKNDRDSICHPRMLSDGSLRFICLATVLLQPLELMPEIVIIDEPELGLHPQALALVASLVQRLSMQRQFIIATQSSNFIDMFAAHDIVVVDKEKDGTSKFTRLDDDKLAHWLDDEYSITDLWDMNIIGGRP